MAGFQKEIRINKPPVDVFNFAADFDNVSKWIPEIVRIEPLTDGPLRAGTKFRETRRMGSREFSAVIEVTEHEAPRVHAASSSCFGIHFTYRYLFEPDGAGTRVRLEAIAKSKWYAAPFVGMMLNMMEKKDGEQLTLLKKAIESNGR